MPGQFASADPDADNAGPAQMINHREEILGCLLVGEPADGTDHRGTGGNTESTARAVSGPRRRVRAVPLQPRPVHGHPDGTDPFGGNQPPPDRLDRYPGSDAQRHVGDAAKPPLDGDVGTAPAAGLELVKGEAMVGMDDSRHGRAAGGHPPEHARLRRMRMCHVKGPLPQ